ncbi:MAG: hypothetical protein KF726_11475 [Anaerolineae bacterium]|nr:hypothetical protein [Anaerolineae bacterium]
MLRQNISLPLPTAVDPLSLLLPQSVWVKVIEGIHPHTPSAKVIEQAVAAMSVEEKEYTLNRVKQVKEYIEIVEKAIH